MFGKKESIKLDKLKEGYTFKLKSNVWRIIEIAEYDWSGEGRSIEYVLKSNNEEEAYLEVEFLKGDYEVYFSKAVSIEHDLLIEAINTRNINYLGVNFSIEEQYRGAYKNLTNKGSWENLTSYMFYSKNEDILTIEDWGNGQYQVFYGQEIKASKIKNITPN